MEDPINIEITVPDVDLFVSRFEERLDECWITKCTSFCYGFTKEVQQKLLIVTLERKAYFVHFKSENIVELRFKNAVIFRDDTPFHPAIHILFDEISSYIHYLLFGLCLVKYKSADNKGYMLHNAMEQARAEGDLKKRQHNEGSSKSAKTTKRIRRGNPKRID